jgi:hypothetical protein
MKMAFGNLGGNGWKWLSYASVLFVVLATSGVLLAYQRINLRDFAQEELPAGADELTEWAFARLRYNSFGGGFGRRSRSRWTTDYPKAERQYVQGVRRLTRIHTRSIEEVVDPSSDALFDWPWVYAVEVGSWDFSEDQAERMRAFLLKGGFLMVDDFHGTLEWEMFQAGLRKIFPERAIEELPNQDEIFHSPYDLDQRVQVPGIQYLYSGRTFERDGVNPVWRAVRDDSGHIVVAICHNMDLGDAWEWADLPQYPENYTSLAYRIGINYIVYAMTH